MLVVTVEEDRFTQLVKRITTHILQQLQVKLQQLNQEKKVLLLIATANGDVTQTYRGLDICKTKRYSKSR